MHNRAKIIVREVSKRFGEAEAGFTQALSKVTLEIAAEEILCLVGPSGCGKTTLLNIVAGFDQASSGEILLDGTPISRIGPDRAVIFQSPALFPWCTVFENVVFGARRIGVPTSDYEPRARRLLAAVRLAGFEDHYPYQLSIGMRQRVQIARALLMSPKVILMDEPFGALDFQTRLAMQELLQSIWVDFRPTILFITHDIEEAVFLGDRVTVMSKRPGHIIEECCVPFPKPRTYELTSQPIFQEIKDRILHLIRREVNLAAQPTEVTQTSIMHEESSNAPTHHRS